MAKVRFWDIETGKRAGTLAGPLNAAGDTQPYLPTAGRLRLSISRECACLTRRRGN